MKTLNDFPSYVKVKEAVDKLRSEQNQISERMGEITAEWMKPKRKIDGQDAWDLALEGGDNMPVVEIDSKAALREEYGICEARLRFIEKALDTGAMELDKVHGRVSLEICKEHRPRFVEQIAKLLESVKAVCAANEELERLRAEIVAGGVRSDSIPHCLFDIGSPWENEYGSKASFYRKHIFENFPELEPATAKLRRAMAGKDNENV
jgi:hypothetical protein